MAFKRLSGSNNNSKAKTSSKAPARKRGTGNYNILKFGKSTLDEAPSNKPFAYNLSITFNEDESIDEEGNSYSRFDAIITTIAGLACDKNGRKRGANFYFFNNEDKEKSGIDAQYTGSARFDIKLNDSDTASQNQQISRIKKALSELQQAPELFEGEKNYIKVANVFLDEARASDSYEFKARALLYSRPTEVAGLAEFDVDTIAALTVARCAFAPLYGAIWENNRGLSGSISFALDTELYNTICDLCDVYEINTTENTETAEEEEVRQYELTDADDDEDDEDVYEAY